jgi:hypothetical protein
MTGNMICIRKIDMNSLAISVQDLPKTCVVSQRESGVKAAC